MFEGLTVDIKNKEYFFKYVGLCYFGDKMFEDRIFVKCDIPYEYGLSNKPYDTGYYRILNNYLANNMGDYHQRYKVLKIHNPSEEFKQLQKKTFIDAKNACYKGIKERFEYFDKIENDLGINSINPIEVDTDGNIIVYGNKTTDLTEIANALNHIKMKCN